ncbi:MAG: HPr family phosphocarrier protein [Planctomycetaceae bacterium]|nr:HPr family phosphocarrier protein [Planctomycetaceae bacterium]
MSEPSVTRTVVVTDPSGVHARTAVAIAEAVRRGQSRVTLVKNGRPVAGTDVLQILTMVAGQGETVTIEAEGPDAEMVVAGLEPLFAGRFGDNA